MLAPLSPVAPGYAQIYLRLVMYMALAVVIGVGWWQLPMRADMLLDRFMALGYAVSFFIFMSIAVLPVYLNEKHIVERERANASYTAFAYVAGHFAMEVVFIFFMALVISSIVYWMVGFNSEPSRFFFYFLTLALALLCAEGVMLAVAAAVPFLLGGIAVGAFLYGLFMVVMGGLIDIARIPWPVRWAHYLSLHTFALAAIGWNEMTGLVFEAAPDAVPPIPDAVRGEQIIANVGYPLTNKWANIAVVAAMSLAYRLIALAVIQWRWTGKK